LQPQTATPTPNYIAKQEGAVGMKSPQRLPA
jgi:hypothetical protein